MEGEKAEEEGRRMKKEAKTNTENEEKGNLKKKGGEEDKTGEDDNNKVLPVCTNLRRPAGRHRRMSDTGRRRHQTGTAPTRAPAPPFQSLTLCTLKPDFIMDGNNLLMHL